MDDPNNPTPVPVPEPPPAPPLAPPPEVEAVDEHGVPWKNRAAEYERKLREADENKQERLVEAVRSAAQPQQPKPDRYAKVLSQWKPEDQAGLRQLVAEAIAEAVDLSEQRAQQVGYKLMTKVSLQSLMQQNPAIKAEAEKIYPTLKANPFWANISDEQVEVMAIQQAAASVQARQPGNPAPAPVNLPQNRGGGAPPSAGDPKEKFVKEWMASEENRSIFAQMYRGKFTVDSEAGQKALREAAEIAYQEGQKPLPFFGPNSVVGRAATSILNQAKGNV